MILQSPMHPPKPSMDFGAPKSIQQYLHLGLRVGHKFSMAGSTFEKKTWMTGTLSIPVIDLLFL